MAAEGRFRGAAPLLGARSGQVVAGYIPGPSTQRHNGLCGHLLRPKVRCLLLFFTSQLVAQF